MQHITNQPSVSLTNSGSFADHFTPSDQTSLQSHPIVSRSEQEKLKVLLKNAGLLNEEYWIIQEVIQGIDLSILESDPDLKSLPTEISRFVDAFREQIPYEQFFMIGGDAKAFAEKHFKTILNHLFRVVKQAPVQTAAPIYQRASDTDFKAFFPRADLEALKNHDATTVQMALQARFRVEKSVSLLTSIDKSFVTTSYINAAHHKMDVILTSGEERNHLFVNDAVAILLGEKKKKCCRVVFLLKENPLQVVVDNEIKVIHIHDLKTVNALGWPRAMRLLAQGYTFANGSDPKGLLETSLKGHKNLAELFLRCHELHDGGDTHALLFAFLCGAWELRSAGVDLEEIWEKIKAKCIPQEKGYSLQQWFWEILPKVKKVAPVLDLIALGTLVKLAKNACNGPVQADLVEHKRQLFLKLEEHHHFLIPCALDKLYDQLKETLNLFQIEDLSHLLSILMENSECDAESVNPLLANNMHVDLDEPNLAFRASQSFHASHRALEKICDYYFILILQALFPSEQKIQFLIQEFLTVQTALPKPLKFLILNFIERHSNQKTLSQAASFLIRTDSEESLYSLWQWQVFQLKSLPELEVWNLLEKVASFYPEDTLKVYKRLITEDQLSILRQWQALDLFKSLPWRTFRAFFATLFQNIKKTRGARLDPHPLFGDLIKRAYGHNQWDDLELLLSEFIPLKVLIFDEELCLILDQAGSELLKIDLGRSINFWKMIMERSLSERFWQDHGLSPWLFKLYCAIFEQGKDSEEAQVLKNIEKCLLFQENVSFESLSVEILPKEPLKALIYFKILSPTNSWTSIEKKCLFWALIDLSPPLIAESNFCCKIYKSILEDFFCQGPFEEREEAKIVSLFMDLRDRLAFAALIQLLGSIEALYLKKCFSEKHFEEVSTYFTSSQGYPLTIDAEARTCQIKDAPLEIMGAKAWAQLMALLSQGYRITNFTQLNQLSQTLPTAPKAIAELILQSTLSFSNQAEAAFYAFLNSISALQSHQVAVDEVWKEIKCQVSPHKGSSNLHALLWDLCSQGFPIVYVLDLLQVLSLWKLALGQNGGSIQIKLIQDNQHTLIQLKERGYLLLSIDVEALDENLRRLPKVAEVEACLPLIMHVLEKSEKGVEDRNGIQESSLYKQTFLKEDLLQDLLQSRDPISHLLGYFMLLIQERVFPAKEKATRLRREFLKVESLLTQPAKRKLLEVLKEDSSDPLLFQAALYLLDHSQGSHLPSLWKMKGLNEDLDEAEHWALMQHIYPCYPQEAQRALLGKIQHNSIPIEQQWQAFYLMNSLYNWEQQVDYVRQILENQERTSTHIKPLPLFLEILKWGKNKQKWDDISVLLEKFVELNLLKPEKELWMIYEKIGRHLLDGHLAKSLQLWKKGLALGLSIQNPSKSPMLSWTLELYAALYRERLELGEAHFLEMIEKAILSEKFNQLKTLIKNWITSDTLKAIIYYKIFSQTTRLKLHEKEELFWLFIEQKQVQSDKRIPDCFYGDLLGNFLRDCNQKQEKFKEERLYKLAYELRDRLPAADLQKLLENFHRLGYTKSYLSKNLLETAYFNFFKHFIKKAKYAEGGRLWNVGWSVACWKSFQKNAEYHFNLSVLYQHLEDGDLKKKILKQLTELSPSAFETQQSEEMILDQISFLSENNMEGARQHLDHHYQALSKKSLEIVVKHLLMVDVEVGAIFGCLKTLRIIMVRNLSNPCFSSLEIQGLVVLLSNNVAALIPHYYALLNFFDEPATSKNLESHHLIELVIVLTACHLQTQVPVLFKETYPLIEGMSLIFKKLEAQQARQISGDSLDFMLKILQNIFRDLDVWRNFQVIKKENFIGHFFEAFKRNVSQILHFMHINQNEELFISFIRLLHDHKVLLPFDSKLRQQYVDIFYESMKKGFKQFEKFFLKYRLFFDLIGLSQDPRDAQLKSEFFYDFMLYFWENSEVSQYYRLEALNRSKDVIRFQSILGPVERSEKMIHKAFDCFLQLQDPEDITSQITFFDREYELVLQFGWERFQLTVLNLIDGLIKMKSQVFNNAIEDLILKYEIVSETPFWDFLSCWEYNAYTYRPKKFNLYKALIRGNRCLLSSETHLKILLLLLQDCDLTKIIWMNQYLLDLLKLLNPLDRITFLKELIPSVAKINVGLDLQTLSIIKDQVFIKDKILWEAIQDIHLLTEFNCLLREGVSNDYFIAGCHQVLLKSYENPKLQFAEIAMGFFLEGIKRSFWDGASPLLGDVLRSLHSYFIHADLIDLPRGIKLLEAIHTFPTVDGYYLGFKWLEILIGQLDQLPPKEEELLKKFLLGFKADEKTLPSIAKIAARFLDFLPPQDREKFQLKLLYEQMKNRTQDAFNEEQADESELEESLRSYFSDRKSIKILLFFDLFIEDITRGASDHHLDALLFFASNVKVEWQDLTKDCYASIEGILLIFSINPSFKQRLDYLLDQWDFIKDDLRQKIEFEGGLTAMRNLCLQYSLEESYQRGNEEDFTSVLMSWNEEKIHDFFCYYMIIQGDEDFVQYFKRVFYFFGCLTSFDQQYRVFTQKIKRVLENQIQVFDQIKQVYPMQKGDVQNNLGVSTKMPSFENPFHKQELEGGFDFSFTNFSKASLIKDLLFEWLFNLVHSSAKFDMKYDVQVLMLLRFLMKSLSQTEDVHELDRLVFLTQTLFKIPTSDRNYLFNEFLRKIFHGFFLQLKAKVYRVNKTVESLKNLYVLELLLGNPKHCDELLSAADLKEMYKVALRLISKHKGKSSGAFAILKAVSDVLVGKMSSEEKNLVEYEIGHHFIRLLELSPDLFGENLYFDKKCLSFINCLGEQILYFKSVQAQKKLALEYLTILRKCHDAKLGVSFVLLFAHYIPEFLKLNLFQGQEQDLKEILQYFLKIIQDHHQDQFNILILIEDRLKYLVKLLKLHKFTFEQEEQKIKELYKDGHA